MSKKKGMQEGEQLPDKEEVVNSAETKENENPEMTAAFEEIEKLKNELATEKDKYLRVLAEYDNYRKRSQKERENIFTDVRSETVTRFLPVYDNLLRALAQETADEAYRKGVEMIMTQFNEVIEKLGITVIETIGKTFDPDLHNAVMHIEDESLGENEIVEEFQKGFKMGDKVIRYSMVKVAN